MSEILEPRLVDERPVRRWLVEAVGLLRRRPVTLAGAGALCAAPMCVGLYAPLPTEGWLGLMAPLLLVILSASLRAWLLPLARAADESEPGLPVGPARALHRAATQACWALAILVVPAVGVCLLRQFLIPGHGAGPLTLADEAGVMAMTAFWTGGFDLNMAGGTIGDAGLACWVPDGQVATRLRRRCLALNRTRFRGLSHGYVITAAAGLAVMLVLMHFAPQSMEHWWCVILIAQQMVLLPFAYCAWRDIYLGRKVNAPRRAQQRVAAPAVV